MMKITEIEFNSVGTVTAAKGTFTKKRTDWSKLGVERVL